MSLVLLYAPRVCEYMKSFERSTNCVVFLLPRSKITELEEELKVVGNNMKSLEISEQEVVQFQPSPPAS